MINIGVEQEMLNKLCEYEPLNEFLTDLKDPMQQGMLNHKINEIRQQASISDNHLYLMVDGMIEFRDNEDPMKIREVMRYLEEKYSKFGLRHLNTQVSEPELKKIAQHGRYWSTMGIRNRVLMEYRWVLTL